MTGIVTHFNAKRGFGFVKPLAGDGPDAAHVFFHISAVRSKGGEMPAFPMGAEVSFDLVRGDKGPQCANVELVKVNGRALRKENHQ